MNKQQLIVLVLVLAGLLQAFGAAAQLRGGSKKVKTPVPNVVKVGIDNYFFGRADFAYERQIFGRHSAQIELGIGFPVNIPSRFTASFTLPDNDSTTFAVALSPGKWRAYSFVAEYRFYMLEDAPRGLYIAPYIKYKPRGFDVEGSYTRPDSVDISGRTVTTVSADVQLKGGWRTFGLGAMLGYQFIINDRISIDIAPLGLGVDFQNIYLQFSTDDADINNNFEDWNTAVTNQVRDIPIIGNRLKMTNGDTDAGGKFIRAALNFPFFAYRGGVWIGYAF